MAMNSPRAVSETLNNNEDMLSFLPTEVQRRILFFLPGKDAARTSVLSRSWHRTVWCSLPVVSFHFDQAKFIENGKSDEFIDYVDTSLQRLHFERFEIVEFRLVISHLDSAISHNIDGWLQLVANNNVQELYISIDECDQDHTNIMYNFPRNIHISGPLKVIEVKGCRLEASFFKSRFLEKLILMNAAVDNGDDDDDDEIMQRFFSRCPLIKKLVIANCSGLSSLRISNHAKLQSITIRASLPGTDNPKPPVIEIDELNLKTLALSRMPRLFYSTCSNLRCLDIRRASINSLFENLESYFPRLADLRLAFCTELRKITNIKHSQLKHLLLCNNDATDHLTIDAPSLVTLRDVTSVGIPQYRFSIIGAAVAGVFLSPAMIRRRFFVKLMKFLKQFNEYKVMIALVVKYEFGKARVLTLTDELEGLKTREPALPEKIEDFVDELFWSCQPKILVVTPAWGLYHDLLKIMSDQRQEDSLCCIYSDVKCRHHNLKDIKIDCINQTKPDQESLLQLQALDACNNNIVFKLEWV